MSDDEDLSFSLDLRSLSVRLTIDEDDPVLVLSDGAQTVAIEPGAGGRAEDAIAGAERLAERATQLASVLKVRNGSRTPLTPREPVEDDPIEWRQPDEPVGDARLRP
jgi:hypothetical protein